ncbi:tautomerase family protein, partial [Rhodoferax sp.]|uniref:tautomerase family protein n=1 Tax=Rhodoferax sp. TaxID=50421 RepID=UPI002628B742
MPTLLLKVSPPQTPARHQALAQALTELTARHLGKRPEVTAVLIDALPAAQWHVGGRSVAGPTAFLEISVTQGTNTAQQKADFIAAAFEELQ